MAYDPSEIHGLLEDVLQPFRGLDADETEAQEIEAGTFDWESAIPPELGDPVPASSRSLTELFAMMDNVLSIPTRPVVNLSKYGTKADEEKDALEVFFDYWRFRTDPYGVHRRRRREHMIRSRFAPAILSHKPYAPEGDDYDESYWRWELHSPDPKSIGVLADGDRYSIAVVKEEIPYLDMAKYLSGRKDKEPPKAFLSRKLGGITLADGSAPWSEQATDYNKLRKIMRCIVYTKDDICQYINVKGNSSGETQSTAWAQVEDTEPNPFGQVPVVLFPGIHRSHMPIRQAYEGLIWPAAQIEYNIILMQSIALTIYGNQKLIDMLDPDITRQLIEAAQNGGGQQGEQLQAAIRNLVQPQRDNQGRKGTSLAFGNVADLTPKLDATFATALQFFIAERDRLWMQWQSVFPDPETVEKSTAAGLIASIEQGQRRSEHPLAVMISGEQRLMEMVAYDIAMTHKKDVSFKVGGQELTVERDGLESGSEFEVTPDMMKQFVDGSAWVSLEPVPSTKAQQSAAVAQEIQMQTATGVKNSKRLYEASGESNVTARLEEDAALTNAAYLGPGAAQMAMTDVINEFALEQERPVEIVQGLWVPQFSQQQGQGQQQGKPGYTYNAPEIPMAGTGAGSTAPGVMG